MVFFDRDVNLNSQNCWEVKDILAIIVTSDFVGESLRNHLKYDLEEYVRAVIIILNGYKL